MAHLKPKETAGNKPEQKPEGQLPPVKESAEEKIRELTELLQRTQANLENYRKQMEKRMEEVEQFAGKRILLQLLPIIDEFELALSHEQAREKGETDGQNASPELVKGIELMYANLMAFLERQGVQPMKAEGERFDPYKHEALLKVPSEKPENTIMEEFQRGYLLHGQVLRHARVKVSAGRKQKEDDNPKQE